MGIFAEGAIDATCARGTGTSGTAGVGGIPLGEPIKARIAGNADRSFAMIGAGAGEINFRWCGGGFPNFPRDIAVACRTARDGLLERLFERSERHAMDGSMSERSGNSVIFLGRCDFPSICQSAAKMNYFPNGR